MSPKLTDNRKEGRRLQILDAAKRIFTEKGYGAATLTDIIEATGMSRGWIYLYYPNKDEIFEALLDQQDVEQDQYLAQLMDSSTSIWELVEKMYSQQLEQLLHSPNGGMLSAFYEYFLIGWREESRRELLLHRYEKGIAKFARLLEIGVERGEFSPVMDIADIAKLAASFQEGIMTHAITIDLEKVNIRMQFEALVNYMKSLLRPLSHHQMSRWNDTE